MFAGQGMTIGNPFQQYPIINPIQSAAAALAARCAVCGTPAAVSGLYQQYIGNPLSVGSSFGMGNPGFQTAGSGLTPPGVWGGINPQFTPYGVGAPTGIHPAIAAGLQSVNPALMPHVAAGGPGNPGIGLGGPGIPQQQWPQQPGFPATGINPNLASIGIGGDPQLAALIGAQQNPITQLPIRSLLGIQQGNPFFAQQSMPFGNQQQINPFLGQPANPFLGLGGLGVNPFQTAG